MEGTGHTIDGGTRGETEAIKAAIEKSEEDEPNGDKEDEKPDLKRKGTMQETIEVGNSAKLFRVPVDICSQIFRVHFVCYCHMEILCMQMISVRQKIGVFAKWSL